MDRESEYFEFQGARFVAIGSFIRFIESGKEHAPSKIHGDFLYSLLKNSPGTVSYEDLWRQVWHANRDLADTDRRNIQTTKGQLALWLDSIGIAGTCIKASPTKGYFLDCPVTPGTFSDQKETLNLWSKAHTPIAEHNSFAYIVTTSVMYGFLFFIAVLLEIAYDFDRHRESGPQLGMLLMLANTIASLIVFKLIRVRLRNKKKSLLLGVGFMWAVAVFSVIVAVFVLPFEAVTQATYQTQPAFAAFLKNALMFFLPLHVICLMIPFYYVTANNYIATGIIRTLPSDAIFIKPRVLFISSGVVAGYSIISTNYLIDNLRETENHTLFVSLAFLRFVIYFTLAFGSLFWYYLKTGTEKRFSNDSADAVK